MIAAANAFRLRVAVAALGAMVATVGHAAAENHDSQVFRLPTATSALHDRAPSPGPQRAEVTTGR